MVRLWPKRLKLDWWLAVAGWGVGKLGFGGKITLMLEVQRGHELSRLAVLEILQDPVEQFRMGPCRAGGTVEIYQLAAYPQEGEQRCHLARSYPLASVDQTVLELLAALS